MWGGAADTRGGRLDKQLKMEFEKHQFPGRSLNGSWFIRSLFIRPLMSSGQTDGRNTSVTPDEIQDIILIIHQ